MQFLPDFYSTIYQMLHLLVHVSDLTFCFCNTDVGLNGLNRFTINFLLNFNFLWYISIHHYAKTEQSIVILTQCFLNEPDILR